MTPRTVILTTDTTHHLYFVWKLSQSFQLSGIFLETKSLKPAFETSHSFEKRRDDYEKEVLLAGCPNTYNDFAETYQFESINAKDSMQALIKIKPDALIVFGTGKLSKDVIALPNIACLNLHGGNPEHYRGLDSHLWAIYHNDFDNLVTTLHFVDAQLDTGDIVAQSNLPISKGDGLHQLRSINTQVCVELSIIALQALSQAGRLPSRRQVMKGRYYSFMPAVLKETCLKNFQKYSESL